MFRMNAAPSRISARAAAVAALSAASFTISAGPASAAEYSHSNHLTAKEQKTLGPVCLKTFETIPPFADTRAREYGRALADDTLRTNFIGCSSKLAWMRQGVDLSNFASKK
jgi:hypothetical protein